MRPIRVGLLVGGIILGFFALGFIAAGSWGLWAYSTQRDDQGFYAFDPEPFAAPGYAITSENVQLGAPNEWFPEDLATVRIRASSDTETFIGIAPSQDVADYLDGVAHSVVSSVDTEPFQVTYRLVQGDGTPPPPGEQTFWVTSTEGAGSQSLTWDLGGGDYTVVLMNADASQGVDVRLSAGVKSDILLPIAIGVLVLGVILAASAITMIVLALRGRRVPSSPTPGRPDQVSA